MPRHGNFSAAVSITEDTINGVIEKYVVEGLGPFFFPLPTTIQVGPTPVTFAGIIQLLPPTVELHPDPNDVIRLNLALRSTLRAAAPGQPMRTWTVRWQSAVDAAPVINIVAKQFTVGVDLSTATVQPLVVTNEQGPVFPAPVLAALQSQALADAVTAFVRDLPQLVITPPLLRTEIEFSQPVPAWVAPYEKGGLGPEWFTVSLTADRVVLKTLERALTLAVDVTGTGGALLTHGDKDALVDLTAVRGVGSTYRHTLTPNSDPEDGPILVRLAEPKGGGIAIAINQWVISHVGEQISNALWKDVVSYSPEIALGSIHLMYAPFDKPLRGPEDGLAVNVNALVREGPWFTVGCVVYVQAYLRTADGPTEFVHEFPDQWRIYAGHTDIDLPWWLDVLAFAVSLSLGSALPMLSGVLGVATIALLDGVLPSIVGNVENLIQQNINNTSPAIPGNWTIPLFGLAGDGIGASLKYLSITQESIDAAATVAAGSALANQPLGVLAPTSWPATNREPIALSVKLREDLEAMADDLTVVWTVRRADTNAVIATGTRAYDDPDGNGITIPHHSPELYHVDRYTVRARVRLATGGQVGEIWTGTSTIDIHDFLDRHHRYVEWGPKTVYFKKPGSNTIWWSRTRKSKIHRTAVSARCRMLYVVTGDLHNVTYTDTLPFPPNQLEQNRGPVCEYCFFDGPDKHVALPTEDWF
ncbi:MAG TPA: hypothetical protein VGX25_01115 [Actinophytocola sp.]|uniref:hypothetical protein n=1 Tax=Actinophytocola sp. TaxID=1872138 RepID=UPI002DDD1907|nr:hypothetical protein [Actinophytocola sp.]HEV2777975.1 hypothetical protein [Actinophytocola sp.]